MILWLGLAWAGDAFVEQAKHNDTDAVIVVRDGVEVVRWEKHPGRRMNVHSVTKSIASIAAGQLVEKEAVEWTTPMGFVYPEWAGDPRGDITLDQVLTHTSGLDPDRGVIPLRPVRHALRSDLEHEPGVKYAYSNNASNLVSGVVEHATGQRMDAYLNDNVFGPLGIQGVRWGPHIGPTPAWSGLRLTADELLAIGQALLDDALLSPEMSMELTEPVSSPYVSRLWWPLYIREFVLQDDSLDLLLENGLPLAEAEKLEPLVDQSFRSWTALVEAQSVSDVDAHALSFTGVTPMTMVHHRVGYFARGWAGQYLVVLPSVNVVAVRQRRSNYEKEGQDPRLWRGFAQDVIELLDLNEELTSGPRTTWPPAE
jgi:CubicO group peptidase (beta-lactamase class C family)